MKNCSTTGVLFDLDGVIVDTEGIYSEFWAEIGERIYPTGVANFENVIKGSTLPTILSKYFPDEAIQADIVNRLQSHEASMRYEMFEGVEEFLSDLKAHGIPAAIVTSSGEKKMRHLFETLPRLQSYFKVVLTDKDVTRSKPDPEGYLKAADAIGRDIAECFVFEDSFSGVKAGIASGATTIAVATTNPEESLRQLTENVIDSMRGMSVERMMSFKI